MIPFVLCLIFADEGLIGTGMKKRTESKTCH